MHIEWLQVQNVRNLTDVIIEPSAGINIFEGPNASGKTAILEAIHFLSRARSFRTPRANEVIQHEKETLLVTAKIQHPRLGRVKTGVERRQSRTSILYNGESVKKLSQQASNIPLILIAPDTHRLITGTPKNRRHWLDWALFHVEPTYLKAWYDYHRSLRHRNSLLKKGVSRGEQLSGWEYLMVEAANKINLLRGDFIKQLQQIVRDYTREIFPSQPSLTLLSGWPKEQSLSVCLESGRESDKQIGYTRHGVHRADIEFLDNSYSLASTYSQGQIKLFVAILLVAQARLFEERTGEKPFFLIDDFAAELDAQSRTAFISLLIKQESQVFLTTTEANSAIVSAESSIMFHVEHGTLTKVIK